MRKFENGIITIVMAIIMMLTSIRGAWEFIYYDLDMTYDSTVIIVGIFGIITIYYMIKNIILRFRNK